LFLFNDILLICSKYGKKHYWCRIFVTLRSKFVSVEASSTVSRTNEWKLHCKTTSFIFYSATADERDDWVNNIKLSISATHPNDVKDANVQKMATELAENKTEIRKLARTKSNQRGPDSSSDDSVDESPPASPLLIPPKGKEKSRARSKSSGAVSKSPEKPKSHTRGGSQTLLGPFLSNVNVATQSLPGVSTQPMTSPVSVLVSAPSTTGLPPQQIYAHGATPQVAFPSTNPFLGPQQVQDAVRGRSRSVGHQPYDMNYQLGVNPFMNVPTNPFSQQQQGQSAQPTNPFLQGVNQSPRGPPFF